MVETENEANSLTFDMYAWWGKEFEGKILFKPELGREFYIFKNKLIYLEFNGICFVQGFAKNEENVDFNLLYHLNRKYIGPFPPEGDVLNTPIEAFRIPVIDTLTKKMKSFDQDELNIYSLYVKDQEKVCPIVSIEHNWNGLEGILINLPLVEKTINDSNKNQLFDFLRNIIVTPLYSELELKPAFRL